MSPGWERPSSHNTWVSWHPPQQGRCLVLEPLTSQVSPKSFPFRAYDNILKDAVAVKSQALAMVPGTPPAPTQVLFQPPAYPGLSQPTAMALAQFQTPVQDLCVAYRDSLQAHHSGTLLSGGSGSSLHALYPTLQPLDVCPVPLPTSLSMHMAIAAEPRHCLAATYGSSYFSGSHAFPAGCFDR